MNGMVLRLCAVLCVLGVASVARADDAKGPRVGVVIELTVDVEPSRADAFGGALADALNRELVVDAVGGADVSRALPAEGLPDECVGNDACVKDVASRIDATELLFLALVQVGSDVQVDASWVDVATGEVVARPRVTVPADARAVSVFADQAQRYLPDAKVREHGGDTIIVQPTVKPGTPRTMSTPAWILGGVAVAALGAGVGLGLSTRSAYHACEPAGTCDDDRLSSIALRAHLADASFAVAAGAAIATVILYLRSGTPDEMVEPTVTPTSGGAVFELAGHW
jgi:hypothetical protein